VRIAPGSTALAIVLCAAAACAGGGDGGEPSSTRGPRSGGRLETRPLGSVPGAPLGYLEYLPPAYGIGDRQPLLVFLHGSDENGDGSRAALRRVRKTGIPMLIARDAWPADRPFVVLMPQYPPGEADSCDLADEIDAFLAFAVRRYDVDPERVYLTGLSCGAIGAWAYLREHLDESVAGAVLIAGVASVAYPTAGCDLGRVPVWAFHGALDTIVSVSYSERALGELNACRDPVPVDLRWTVYPDAGHDAWSRTYDLSAGHDIYAWLLAHHH
jgi:predicted peptidase